MMKTIKYITLGIAGLSMVACSDFFSTDSPSAMDASDVYSNLTRTEQAIAGIYNEMGADKSYRNRLACGYHGMNTDIEHNTKNSGKADYATYQMTTTSADISTSNGKDPWGYLNTMIERANNIIEGIETYGNLENETFQYYLGEAYFLRSFAYLEMVKIWGDVPARFESLAKNPEGLNTLKTDRNVIFEQLRIDLQKAADYLPWSASCPGTAANYTGRPSKAAALALLARSNLMYAGYALRPDQMVQGGCSSWSVQLNTTDATLRTQLYKEVLDACGQIINNSIENAKFKSNFEDVFKDICQDVTTYSSTEYIWSIPFSNGSRGQFLNYNTSKGTGTLKALKNNTSGSTNAVQTVVPTLLFDYENGDIRRDITILPYMWKNDAADGISSDVDKRAIIFPGTAAADKRLYQSNQKIGDFYLGKYRIEWMARERAGNDDGIDYPVMRYTDVLLMFAEAAIGGITGDVPANTTGVDAQIQFDRVRTRAGLASKTLTMENLMDERKFEFCGEYIRKYDLMRWGKLKEKLVETTARLQALSNHTGEFAQTSDTIYFKYKQDNSFVYEGSGLNGYVMDSIWGLRKGETGRPATYSAATGWVAKDIYTSDATKVLNATDYILYADEKTIDSRHYWPIFSVNVGASNGTLWNDYGY